jgi:ribosomal-protein-alanine N-acetyltransferase
MSAVTSEALYRVRAMKLEDVPAVLAVEQASYDFPWSEGIFRDCLRVGYRCRVLFGPEGVVGYYILSVGVHEAHLLNLCVHPQLRGLSLGRELLTHAMALAGQQDAASLFLEVRPSNKAALALYESMGFVEIGNRKDYYRSRAGREDAIILARELS